MSADLLLTAQPLTPTAFAPYGHVIEADGETAGRMNGAAFDRFDALAPVLSAAGGPEPKAAAQIGVVRARQAAVLPHPIPLVERHPLGSQAFIPLGSFRYYVVVGRAGEQIAADALEAFACEDGQGISYAPGTWHMPLMALAAGQTFLVIDQGDRAGNLDERMLENRVLLAG